MRQPRLKSEESAHYHCISRIVGRDFLIDDEGKEFFSKLLRLLAIYHDCRVLTYCIMSNHFHLLLETPGKEAASKLGRKQILERVRGLYGEDAVRELMEELDRAAACGDPGWEESILDRYRHQMGDLSVFMKQLKQRFTIWYNHRTGRKGTLWEERYKSVLVEGSTQALLAVAAYIDLNPLRAGMVGRVEDYRWSGYAAAVAGNRMAREGLGCVFDRCGQVSDADHSGDWERTASDYRLMLYGAGEIREWPEAGERPTRHGFTREEVEAEIARGGKLPLSSVLRVKVRYFSDGMVLGSTSFVDGVSERHRNRCGARRSSGAKTMRGADWGDLRVMRDLRSRVFG